MVCSGLLLAALALGASVATASEEATGYTDGGAGDVPAHKKKQRNNYIKGDYGREAEQGEGDDSSLGSGRGHAEVQRRHLAEHSAEAPTCQLEQNINYSGNDLNPGSHATSAAECCAACEADASCQFFRLPPATRLPA